MIQNLSKKKKTNKLMVGYKILSFLDVIEILITTRRKANEVANIHKKKKKIEPPKDKSMYQERPWTLVSHRI